MPLNNNVFSFLNEIKICNLSMARYRLVVLKVPLNTNQSTMQPSTLLVGRQKRLAESQVSASENLNGQSAA